MTRLTIRCLLFAVLVSSTFAPLDVRVSGVDSAFAQTAVVKSKPTPASTDENAETASATERDCATIFAEYQKELRSVAERCDARGMELEARITRARLYDEEPFYFIVPVLPAKKSVAVLPDDASSEQKSWFAKLERTREKYANETFRLAKKYAAQQRGFDVVACLLTTLFIDPDHRDARRFFGYKEYDGAWRSAWEIKKLERGFVDDPKFGWIPKEDVDKYREGKRLWRGEWISAEEEAKNVLAGAGGWKIETEHYSILSRVSLERGVEVGRFLETYHRVWLRLFYRFVASEKQWAARLNSNVPFDSRRRKVVLYRDRGEYLRELKKHDENVEVSIGGYFSSLRCVFLYEPAPDDEFDFFSLLAHEATHQLFNERGTGNATNENFAQYANYWAVEGFAVYAETFKPGANAARLGGFRDDYRIQCAFESLFDDGTYVPLRRYAALSLKAFQRYPDLSLAYSQASGLAFFFMHYRNGIYRDAFVDYLRTIYAGRDLPNSLERATGKSFEQLDAEYADFMRETRALLDRPTDERKSQ